MPLGESSFSTSLEVLKELLHSLRTPLGVALTIAKDSKNNLPLSPTDHEDAVKALEKIREHFEELKPLLNLGELQNTKIEFNELSLICEVEGFGLVSVEEEINPIDIEISLLKIWLQSLYKVNKCRTLSYLRLNKGACISMDIAGNKPLVSNIFSKLLSAACDSSGMAFMESDTKSTLITFG